LALFFVFATLSAGCAQVGLQPYSDTVPTDSGVPLDDDLEDTQTDPTPGGTDTAPTDTGTDTDTDTTPATGCGTGEIEDCGGTCLPAQWLGDGLCQARFDCAALDFDDGDCDVP